MAAASRKSDLDILRYAGLGTQLALTMALFGWGGYELDRWLDSSPLLLILGCLLGMALGMYAVIRDVSKMTGSTSKESSKETEAPDDAP